MSSYNRLLIFPKIYNLETCVNKNLYLMFSTQLLFQSCSFLCLFTICLQSNESSAHVHTHTRTHILHCLSTLKNVLLYLSTIARHMKISEVTGKLFFSVCPTVYDVNIFVDPELRSQAAYSFSAQILQHFTVQSLQKGDFSGDYSFGKSSFP